MRLHSLNCGTMCPPASAAWIDGGPWWRRGRLVCHCLLCETRAGLVLVDTGMGTGDRADPARLGLLFRTFARPTFDPAETAVAQVRALGFDPSDVRDVVVTHLDLDHAGGLSDFPDANVHVWAGEHRAANGRPDPRYVPAQWAHGPRWRLHEEAGETWFGFEAVRAVPGTDDEVLLVPLFGHTAGHCGVAVRGPDRWTLHAGDAFYHRAQLEGGAAPLGMALFQRLVDHDRAARVRNQRRLVELHRDHGAEVRVVCAHDPVMLEACRVA